MIQTFLVVLILVLAMVLGSNSRLPAEPGDSSKGFEKSGPGAVVSLSRAELQKRLEIMGKANPPDPASLSVGAMCYDMVMAQPTEFFICRKCQAKNYFPSDWSGAKQAVAAFKQIKAVLELPENCAKCNSDTGVQLVSDLKPRIHIRYPGEEQEVVSPIEVYEVDILAQFLSGSDRYRNETAQETPMKNYLPRLKEILGEK